MNILVFTSLFPNNEFPNHGIFIQERVRYAHVRNRWNMKVVAPVPYYPPGLGGWRKKYRDVLHHEVREGLDVWHPRYVMVPKIGMMLQGVLLFLSVCWKILSLHRTFPFVLIDAHYVYPDGFAAILLSWLTGVPVVVSVRGSDVNLFKDLPIIRHFIVWTLRYADAVIVVSGALKQISIDLGVEEEKIHVIPNGVDPEKFFSVPQKKARRKIRSKEDQFMILMVCHLTANKGVDVLLKSLALLKSRRPSLQWTCCVVGDGFIRGDLEQLSQELNVASRVRFCGAIAHDELVWFYNSADILCLLSEREGWPNVVVESLACGTPILATAVGGVPEIVAIPDIGVLVEREPEAVASALEQSVDQHWHRSYIRHYARRFQWSETADAIRQVFQPLVPSMPPSSHHMSSPSSL